MIKIWIKRRELELPKCPPQGIVIQNTMLTESKHFNVRWAEVPKKLRWSTLNLRFIKLQSGTLSREEDEETASKCKKRLVDHTFLGKKTLSYAFPGVDTQKLDQYPAKHRIF